MKPIRIHAEDYRQRYIRQALWHEFWRNVEPIIWIAVLALTALNLYWIVRGK